MKSEELSQNAETESTVKTAGIGVRHMQVFLLFSGMVIGYCLRVSMSEAIVAMVNSNQSSTSLETEVFNWTQNQQGMIKSSFFWGYTIMQLPSGYMAATWSAQKWISLNIFICGILNLLTPTIAHYGDYLGVVFSRVGMGLFQSGLLPCTQTLLAKWAPPSERARFGTFAYAGGQFGTVICFPISGVLASKFGWPSMFYAFGALSLVWSVIFFFFGSDSPAQHPSISEKEKLFIETSLDNEKKEKSDNETKLKTPWIAIFTSVPMWAIIIVHCGQNWGFWTLVTELPTYMANVLGYNLQENGFMSALPYLATWILSFPICWLADFAIKKGVSKAVTRKACNTLAHWGPAVALICLASLSVHDSVVAVSILVVAVALNAGSLCGFQINHIDLSPNFAGTMMSITNCIASVIAIIAPLACDAIIASDAKDPALWNIVFYLSAGIYFVGNLVFIIFGKAEVQTWNSPPPSDKVFAMT